MRSDARVLATLLLFFLAGAAFLPPFSIRLVTEILIAGLFAMSLNLFVGYFGSMSFGHAAFYGISAYVVAILLRDTTISVYWAMIIGPIFACATAWIFCILSGKAIRLYFGLLTIALSQLLYVVAFKWYSFTSGDTGITGIRTIEGLEAANAFLVFVIAIFALCAVIMWALLRSPFGLSLRAVRENRERAQFVGIDVLRYQLISFSISGLFAGVAGALHAQFYGIVHPELLHWSKSAEPLLMCLFGGLGTFTGPLIGAAFFIAIDKVLGRYTEYTMMYFGIIIVVTVLVAPEGIYGFLARRIFGNRKA